MGLSVGGVGRKKAIGDGSGLDPDAYLSGRYGYASLIGGLCREPFNLSRAETDQLTYREAWEWFLKPTLERQGKQATTSQSATLDASPGNAVDVSQCNEATASMLFDIACSGKVYEGERWWEPLFERWGVG